MQDCGTVLAAVIHLQAERHSRLPRSSTPARLDYIHQKPNVLQKHTKTSSLKCNTHPRLYWQLQAFSSAVRMFLIRILYNHRTRLALDMSHSTSAAHGTALQWWKQHFYVSGRVMLVSVLSIYETYIVNIQPECGVLECESIYWEPHVYKFNEGGKQILITFFLPLFITWHTVKPWPAQQLPAFCLSDGALVHNVIF